jgi:glycerol uptake facilitator-like aquaporin
MKALRQLLAEYLGTALIVATVLGAGHMVVALEAPVALGLLMIAVCVGAVLFGSIAALSPVSGAHFNPLVSLAFTLRGEMEAKRFIGYTIAQLLGAVSGSALANLMFEKAPFTLSTVDRVGTGVFIGEVLATFGLVLLILMLVDKSAHLIPAVVALWIVAGHIFTSSTSFANPAVSLGRMLSDAPSSISPVSMPGYLLAQGLGLALALLASKILNDKKADHV